MFVYLCAVLPSMPCVCHLCAQKGCVGGGRLWRELYWVCSAWCCVWRVGCVVGGSGLLQLGIVDMVSWFYK